jgi:anti-sigma B factor antagonist
VSEISADEARGTRCVPGRLGWAQRHVDGVVVVHVAGELDLSTSEELHHRLMTVVESGPAALVVLDLSDVRFIDAHSVGLIVAAWAAAKCRGGRLAVDGLRGIPARVFGLLGVEPLLARRICEETAGRDADGRYDRANGVAARQRSVGGANEAG